MKLDKDYKILSLSSFSESSLSAALLALGGLLYIVGFSHATDSYISQSALWVTALDKATSDIYQFIRL